MSVLGSPHELPLVRPMTRNGWHGTVVDGRSVRCVCGLMSLSVLLACASPPPTKLARSGEAAEASKPATSAARPADATAAYHFMLGYQAELAQNSEQALKEYQAALKADPTALSVKARLATLHFSLGDMPNALRYAEEVADGNADDARMLTHMAGIMAQAGKGEKALSVLDRAIELEPESGEAYFTKGLLLLNLKRPAEAEQAMRAGIARAPDNAIGHYHLGRILLEVGKVDDAMASFERAITVNSAFEPAYLALASMHEARHEKDQAVAVLKKYLQHVNPRNREIRHQLVRIYVDAKDYQGARKELEDLLAEDPSDLDAQLRMALIHGEQKEYAQAIDRLNGILKVRPA
ncbi:MAG TPA: tetratricopeptide repeat protein, partial [Mesorhizobium sp.]|nr:tetratricopeptide repeat protein [Mesorhizobium sp.]